MSVPFGRGRPSRLALYAAAALALAILVTTWSPTPHRDSEPTRRTDQAAPIDAAAVLPAASNPIAAAPAAETATEASLKLQALLGQHTVLAADMMRGRLRSDPDLAQAANAALGKNTDAMGQLVAALFGDQAKDQFTSLWASHVAALFNYARGLAEKDDAVTAQAQLTISRFESDLADFFATASQGRLARNAAETAIKQHIEHLIGQTDAYAAGNYQQADRIYREGYAHAFAIGKVLAGTLLPPAAAKVLNAPTWRLRSELDRLLGEHVVVVIAAMRAGVTNSDDFRAAADTVNANTRDLAGAMDTLFGHAAASRFQSLWADHVDALIGYSAAVVKHDARQSADSRTALAAFEKQLAAFIGGATDNRMAASTLAEAFRMHDDMLLRGVDAFVSKDYRQAHDIAYAAYEEMFDLAGRLSTAFGATVAARLPVGAVRTGRGGMAAVVGRRGHAG